MEPKEKQIPSMKNEWTKLKKDRFYRTLDRCGWKIRRQFKESIIWEKGKTKIETDDYGLFLWEVIPVKGWERTHGLSDDRVDIGYLAGRDSKILRFKNYPKGVKLFDLSTAKWVK